VSTVVTDLAFGVRLLRASPGFAAITMTTLALAIGATTAVFSVVDGVLLKRLPVADQGRLLVVWTAKPDRGFSHWPLSYPSYVGMRERLRTVSGVAAHPYFGTLPTVLRLDDGSAMTIQRTPVTGEWFDVLGVRARAGRLLSDADDQPGAPHVVVLSSGAATRLFGSIEDALDRRLRLEDKTFTVVGVTPAAFDYPRTAEAWVPAVLSRDSPYVAWDLVVRIAPGFTTEQTVADLGAALSTLAAESGPLGSIPQLLAAPLARPRFQATLVGGFAALAFALSIVGTYGMLSFLVRQRRREIGIRVALGAAPSNVRALVMRPGLVAGVLGVAIGAALAVAAARLVQPVLFGVTAVDPAVLVVTGACLLAAVLGASLVPMRAAVRTNPLTVIRSE
jgi:putative ABC transport system permease protein